MHNLTVEPYAPCLKVKALYAIASPKLTSVFPEALDRKASQYANEHCQHSGNYIKVNQLIFFNVGNYFTDQMSVSYLVCF